MWTSPFVIQIVWKFNLGTFDAVRLGRSTNVGSPFIFVREGRAKSGAPLNFTLGMRTSEALNITVITEFFDPLELKNQSLRESIRPSRRRFAARLNSGVRAHDHDPAQTNLLTKLNAALVVSSTVSRSPRPCRIVARSTAGSSRAGRTHSRLSKPSTTRALSLPSCAALRNQFLPAWHSCRSSGPRVFLRPQQDRPCTNPSTCSRHNRPSPA